MMNEPKKELWKCTTCEKVMSPSDWAGHYSQTKHEDFVGVSSAPKEECEQCCCDECCKKPLKGKVCDCPHHSKEVSREEKPKTWRESFFSALDYNAYKPSEVKVGELLDCIRLDYAKNMFDRECEREPVFTLSEIADLMEEIKGVYSDEIKAAGLRIPHADASGKNCIFKNVDWPRLFRERPDLIETIRKENRK